MEASNTVNLSFWPTQYNSTSTENMRNPEDTVNEIQSISDTNTTRSINMFNTLVTTTSHVSSNFDGNSPVPNRTGHIESQLSNTLSNSDNDISSADNNEIIHNNNNNNNIDNNLDTIITNTSSNGVSRIITRDLVDEEEDNSSDGIDTVSSDESVLINSKIPEAPDSNTLLIRSGNITKDHDVINKLPEDGVFTTSNVSRSIKSIQPHFQPKFHDIPNLSEISTASSIQSEYPPPNATDDPNFLNISEFPTDKLLEILTALLSKIITSNDNLSINTKNTNIDLQNAMSNNNNSDHSIIENNILHSYTDNELPNNNQINSILCFRGKHIPQISLYQYFQRIQKYCPISNDVFLSLLVYFDRISKRCNTLPTQNGNSDDINEISKNLNNLQNINNDNDNDDNQKKNSQIFVMDSYNIHRLIIAGVTVATKFFSDFFYSNARYAKVGGITLQELNHLELQFLILCDFKLLISVNELQRYADLVYRFWNNTTTN